ncbi:MAG: hypothetical protein ABJ081_03580 [Hyphomicrobiales bacterium]
MSQPEEKRTSQRTRTLKKGTILFNNRYSSASCMIRNESEAGLLLKIYDNHLIPSHFELNVHPNPLSRSVQVMWRTEEFMGVKFTDILEGDAPSVPDDINQSDVVPEPTPPEPQPIDGEPWKGQERRISNVPDRRGS